MEEDSEDYRLLERRMEHFLGLHYEEDVIMNGMMRLTIIEKPFSKSKAKQMNQEMLELADKRDILKSRWDESLGIYDKMEVVDEAEVDEHLMTVSVFFDALLGMSFAFGIAIVIGILFLAELLAVSGTIGMIGVLIGVVSLIVGFLRLPKVLLLGSPMRRLKAFGRGIHNALRKTGRLSEYASRVETEKAQGLLHAIYLQGGSGRDKEIFCKCVCDFFAEIDNQRYILVKTKGRRGNNGFYAVPELFSKNKEDALVFARSMEPYIGKYDLIYTRSETGRPYLLEGRKYAYANKTMRALRKKKVKSALE